MDLTTQTAASILVESPAESLQENIISVVRDLKSEGITGIYVSINKPYKTINNVFIENGVKTEGLFFIDCITYPDEAYDDNVLFISNVSDLGSLSIAVSYFLEKIVGEKFLVIDAVHTLWIYHTPDLIAKFIQNLTERAYRATVNTMVFIVETEDKRLIRKLVPFFDRVIKTGD